jgi:hypothetical protein
VSGDSPAWLDALRRDLIDITEPAAAELWPCAESGAPFYNYRLEHVRQVERDALALLNEVGGDRDVALAAVWIHDRCQPTFWGEEHAGLAAEWAGERLAETGFPAEKVAAVCEAVRLHRTKITPVGAIPGELHEARILWDADKLAHLGAVEVLTRILNTVASDWPGFGEPARRAAAAAAEALEPLSDRPFVPERFYFDVSRRWAAERHEVQKAFARALRDQISR